MPVFWELLVRHSMKLMKLIFSSTRSSLRIDGLQYPTNWQTDFKQFCLFVLYLLPGSPRIADTIIHHCLRVPMIWPFSKEPYVLIFAAASLTLVGQRSHHPARQGQTDNSDVNKEKLNDKLCIGKMKPTATKMICGSGLFSTRSHVPCLNFHPL